MPAFFFDSSALAKCYVIEVGSAWVRAILAPASRNDIHVLPVAEVEVASAIVRRRNTGAISVADAATALIQLRHDFTTDYIVLGAPDQLFNFAVSLVETYGLRAYDAVQLAAAAELNRVRTTGGLLPAAIVSADQELNVV